ncbi:golgin subfamily A member 8B-like, partial [Papio anubis]|uniref:golgin subfamily A member 8B-like n=1 Tax=Papio anubis TaxID=9555 RepID=UPI0012AD5536
DLAARLQRSSQRTEELERALSAVTATQKKAADKSSSRSETLLKTQLERSLQERALMKAHMTQIKESLKLVQLQRDEYAEHIKAERAQWQETMRKMSQELCTLKKEKLHDIGVERSWRKLNPCPRSPQQCPLRRSCSTEEGTREGVSRLQAHNNENKSALHLEQEVEELQEKLGQVNETGTSTQKEPEAAVPAPGTGGQSVSGETPQALQEVMEKLESGLMDLLEEKADLRERVEKLEHQFIQHWRERCHQKIKQLITEPEGRATEATPGGGHHQAGPRRRDEGGAAGAAGVAVAACADRNKGHRKFLAAAQSPDNEPGPGAPPPQELGAAHKHGDLCEVSLSDSAETGQGEAREGSPHDNPTAQPIVQEHQEHPGLGSNRCVPFFCWAWLRRRRR